MGQDVTYPTLRTAFRALYPELASGATAEWFYSGTVCDFGILDSRGNRYRVAFSHLKAEADGCPPDDTYGKLIRTTLGRDKLLQAATESAHEGILVSCHA